MDKERFENFLEVKYICFRISLLNKAYQISLKLSKNILLCQETTREVSGAKKIGLKKKKKKKWGLSIKINMELLL